MYRCWTISIIATLFMQGCVGKVSYVEPPSAPRPGWGCDVGLNICGFQRGVPVEVRVWGEGVCSLVRLNFGDGQFIDGSNIDFGKSGATTPWVVFHTYQGWAGPKTLTAEGVTNCAGKATRTLHVFQHPPNWSPNFSPEVMEFALMQPAASECGQPVPSWPPLRANTMVTVRADPNTLDRLRLPISWMHLQCRWRTQFDCFRQLSLSRVSQIFAHTPCGHTDRRGRNDE